MRWGLVVGWIDWISSRLPVWVIAMFQQLSSALFFFCLFYNFAYVVTNWSQHSRATASTHKCWHFGQVGHFQGKTENVKTQFSNISGICKHTLSFYPGKTHKGTLTVRQRVIPISDERCPSNLTVGNAKFISFAILIALKKNIVWIFCYSEPEYDVQTDKQSVISVPVPHQSGWTWHAQLSY